MDKTDSHYIEAGNALFHYQQYGSGEKLLFCFHGYGRDGGSFHFLDQPLGESFTIIAIDMPFHGLTQFKDKLTFHPNQLIEVMQKIRKLLQKEKEKFYLLGFSMGGRITLHLTQILHRHIERVVLIAPDGLKINFWHWFCTHTWLGNKFLGYSINHAGWVLYLLKLAEKTKVINATVAGFVFYYIHDAEQRKMLYQRWTALRKFTLFKGKLKRLIVKDQIPVKMLFGLKDKIIQSASGRKFRRGVEDFVTVKVINESHYLLTENHAATIGELLNG